MSLMLSSILIIVIVVVIYIVSLRFSSLKNNRKWSIRLAIIGAILGVLYPIINMIYFMLTASDASLAGVALAFIPFYASMGGIAGFFVGFIIAFFIPKSKL